MGNTLPNIFCITATCGRHTLLERLVATFIAQDYEGPHTLLIYNNSDVSQELNLPILPRNKHIELVNNGFDTSTGEPYRNLGAIYRDALLEVSSDATIITHMDDDDIFLPEHISEGVKGYLKAKEGGQAAYKPERSWFRHYNGLDLMGNNLEPSIFIDSSWMREWGYGDTTSDQHLRWFLPLLGGKMLVDPKGRPTLIYNWGDETPTFKTSGNAGNPDNFQNYRVFSQDHGDRIITPNTRGSLNQYYDAVDEAQPCTING